MKYKVLLLVLLGLSSCAHHVMVPTHQVRVPEGSAFISDSGQVVFIPFEDQYLTDEILLRLDTAVPLKYENPKTRIAWSEELIGAPPGYSWVVMGKGPFLVGGVLATGAVDYNIQVIYVSTSIDGFDKICPAAEHELRHAWSGLGD